jgi:hypothetical protein
MAKYSADSALDAQKLELDEAKLMMEAGKSGQDAIMKKQESTRTMRTKDRTMGRRRGSLIEFCARFSRTYLKLKV